MHIWHIRAAGKWWDLSPGLRLRELSRTWKNTGHDIRNCVRSWQMFLATKHDQSSQVIKVGVEWEAAKLHRKLEGNTEHLSGSAVLKGQQHPANHSSNSLHGRDYWDNRNNKQGFRCITAGTRGEKLIKEGRLFGQRKETTKAVKKKAKKQERR